MNEHVASIDLGTTSIKAAIVDARGRIAAMAERPAPEIAAGSGAFDAERYLALVVEALAEAASSVPDGRGGIEGIAIASQRATLVVVGPDGAASGPALSWQGVRCASAGEAFYERFGRERFRRATGLPPGFIYTLPKILDLREADPARMPAGARLATLHDWVLQRLGGGDLVTDHSNASATGLYDPAERRWSPGILEAAGLREDDLPVVRDAGRRAGGLANGAARETGLTAGTPLFVGGGDQQCALVGAGALEAGECVLSLGTAAAIMVPAESIPAARHPGLLYMAHVLPDTWEVEGFLCSWGSTIGWAARILGCDRASGIEALAGESRPGARGPLFLPFLEGIGTPDMDDSVRGQLGELDLGCRREDVARAVLEGLACEVGRATQALASAAPVDRLRVVGGGRGPGTLVRLVADVTGLPVLMARTEQAAILGAAAVALAGSGGCSPAQAASRFETHPGDAIDPGEDRTAARETYSRYVEHAVRALGDRREREPSPAETTYGERPLDIDAIRAEAVEFAGVGIYRYRFDGSIVFMDRGSLRLLDLEDTYPDPDVLPGRDIGTLFEHVDEPGRLRRAVSEQGHVRRFEYHYRTLSGEERWVLHNSYLVGNPATGEDEIQVIAQDITQRKLEEEEKREHESRMLQAQKLESLGVMAGGLAHDFNNLLFAIMGHAELAGIRIESPEAAREQLRQLKTAGDQAARLCQQLLAYAGRGHVEMLPLALDEIVHGTLELISLSISKKAALDLALDRSIPPVQGDPGQIRQILLNLVTNASEALEERPGVIRVSTGVEDLTESGLAHVQGPRNLAPGRYATLSVEDDGHGMGEDVLEHLFDPFFTTKFTGRGLGLASVLGILRSHGGGIRVTSRPGEGSCFTILLPASGEGEQPAAPSTDPDRPWRADGMVLLADDEPVVLGSLDLMLRDVGFEVVTARDGVQAVDLFEERLDRIRLAILDVTMPGLGGIEAAREIRRLRPRVHVLLTSGYNEHDVSEQMSGLEGVRFLRKPFGIADLRRVLRSLLEDRGRISTR